METIAEETNIDYGRDKYVQLCGSSRDGMYQEEKSNCSLHSVVNNKLFLTLFQVRCFIAVSSAHGRF